MEKKVDRSSLILKLTKQNVEVHNIDQPMWKIRRFLNNDPNSEGNQNASNDRQNEVLESTPQSEQEKLTEDEKEQKSKTDGITAEDEQPGTSSGVMKLDGKILCENFALDEITDQKPDYGLRSGFHRGKMDNTAPIKNRESLLSSSYLDRLDAEGSSESLEPFGSGNSEKDPNYETSSSSPSSDSTDSKDKENVQDKKEKTPENSPPKKRGKKRKSNTANWKKNIAKKLRNSGLEYKSTKVVKNQDGKKMKETIIRTAKKLLPPCKEKCRLKCKDKITEETRNSIFTEFWAMGDLQRQRDFIANSMNVVNPKYKYSNLEKRRSANQALSFTIENQNIRVCQKFFIATLGITTRYLRTVVEKQKSQKTGGIIQGDLRGTHNNHSILDPQIKQKIKEHIQSIPRVESHYCRAQSQKEYIDGTKTLSDLHRDYIEWCSGQNLIAAGYRTYYDVFTQEFNISFFFPKKDQCDLCLQFNNATAEEKVIIQEKYDTHLNEKDLCRKERDIDKSSDKLVVSFDLEATLPCPIGNASSFYYISKVNVYNLTFVTSNQDVTCYVWHEGEAKRGANEIGSCVWDYLKKTNEMALKENKTLDVIFYTDNCSGQNKNRFLFALYVFAINKLENINTITHKYLIRGHTQNDSDNIHSVIEKQITRYKKGAPIYVPDQYIALIRQARKKGKPYNIKEMCHSDFLDLKLLTTQMNMKDTYKNETGDSVKISKFKIFEVRKHETGYFFYKNSYAEEDFFKVNVVARRSTPNINQIFLKKAYKQKTGTPESKKLGILSLVEKNIIPRYYFEFYNNL